MIIIGRKTGWGNTPLLQLAQYAARNESVGDFSLEMSAEQLASGCYAPKLAWTLTAQNRVPQPRRWALVGTRFGGCVRKKVYMYTRARASWNARQGAAFEGGHGLDLRLSTISS